MDNWQVHLLVAAKQDPSLKLSLADYWLMNQKAKKGFQQHFGKDFETNLLLNLGYAARMYPKLWQGLETDQPTRLQLNLQEALEFLKESAWVWRMQDTKSSFPLGGLLKVVAELKFAWKLPLLIDLKLKRLAKDTSVWTLLFNINTN